MLPNKWCIQRTLETAAEINGYFNRLHNKPKGYEKQSGWMTNDTKSGEKGPFSKKPEEYTEITFNAFRNEFSSFLAIEQPLAAAPLHVNNVLPENWVVKGDNSVVMRECVSILRNQNKVEWSGNSLGWYGFSNGEYSSRYSREYFGSNTVELTPLQLKTALLGFPISLTQNQHIPVEIPVPFVPPVQEPVIINYQLIKTYPGSHLINSFFQTNALRVFDMAVVGNTEYYLPITGARHEVGDIVTALGHYGNLINNTVYKIVTLIFSQPRQQWIYSIITKSNHTVNNVALSFIRRASPAEILVFNTPSIIINGFSVYKNVENSRFDVANNLNLSITYEAVKNMKNLKTELSPVIINLPGMGVISDVNIDLLFNNINQ